MTGSKIDVQIPSKFKCCGNKYTQSILFLPSRSLDTRSILWYCIISSTVLWIVTSLLGKNLTWMHHLHTLSVGIQPRMKAKSSSDSLWLVCSEFISQIIKSLCIWKHIHTQKNIFFLCTGKNSKGNISVEYLDSLLSAYFIWNMKL